MSAPEENDIDEAELTPEARQIIGKARRSFGFSIAILLLGFIAIVFALVYRSMRDDGGPAAGYGLSEIVLPAGAEVMSVVPSEGMVAVTYELDGATHLRLLSGETGAVLREIAVVAE